MLIVRHKIKFPEFIAVMYAFSNTTCFTKADVSPLCFYVVSNVDKFISFSMMGSQSKAAVIKFRKGLVEAQQRYAYRPSLEDAELTSHTLNFF